MRTAVLFGLAVSAACHRSPAGPDLARTAEGFLLRVTVQPGEIVPGEDATITVTAWNPTSTEITVNGCNDPGCYLGHSIVAVTGEPVALPPRFCRAVCGVFRVGPHEVTQATFGWRGEGYVEPTSYLQGGRWEPVPPGRYDVFGTFSGDAGRTIERSLPATIVVRAPGGPPS